MKKKLVLLASGLSLVVSMNAQWNINGDNSSTGNLNLGSSIDLYNGGIIYGRSGTPNFRAWIEPYNTTTGHMKFWNEFGAGDIIFGTVNTERLRITASGNIGIGTGANTLYQQLSVTGGIGFANQNSADKKLYSPVDGILEWYTHDNAGEHGFTVSHQGERKVYLNTNGNSYFIGGNLGIGTNSPNDALQIGDFNNASNYKIKIPGAYNFEQVRLGQYGNGNCGLELINHSGLTASYGVKLMADIDEVPGFQIQIASPTNAYNSLAYSTKLFINLNGNVGIGTTDPGNYKLNVAGSIRADEIKVNTTGADFVFEPTYKLRPLAEVETFIKQNKHLPNVAPAAEMQTNGVSMGEMQAKLLEKVEELTLYVIELKKEIEVLKKQNNQLKSN